MLVPITGLKSLERNEKTPICIFLPQWMDGYCIVTSQLRSEFNSLPFLDFSLVHTWCDVWNMLWCSYKAFTKWESLIWGFLTSLEPIHLFSIQNTQSLVKYCCWIKEAQMETSRVFAVEWSNSLTLNRSIRSVLKMARLNTNSSCSVIRVPAV